MGLRGRPSWGSRRPSQIRQTPPRRISDPLAISTVANENCPAPGAAQATPSHFSIGSPPQQSQASSAASSRGGCFWPLLLLLALRSPPPPFRRQKRTLFSKRSQLQIILGLPPRQQLPLLCTPARTHMDSPARWGWRGQPGASGTGAGSGRRLARAQCPLRLPLPLPLPGLSDNPAAFPGASLSSPPPTRTAPPFRYALPPPHALQTRATGGALRRAGSWAPRLSLSAPLPRTGLAPAAWSTQPAAGCPTRAPVSAQVKVFPTAGVTQGEQGGSSVPPRGSLPH